MSKTEKGYYLASACFVLLTILLWLVVFPLIGVSNGKKGVEAYYAHDYARTLKYCEPAANKGDAESQFILGCCEAIGVSAMGSYVSESLQDEEAAVEWWKKAAKQGHKDAKFMLKLYNDYSVPISKVASTNPEAAKRGDVVAQNNLGVCYENGYGVPQSLAEAMKWYRKSAEQGYAGAQLILGDCYATGNGVSQSWPEAVKWYRKSAEQGNDLAQNNLGLCYENGEGVSQSWSEAVKWYRKAAEQGSAIAQFKLGLCYEKGNGVLQSWDEAVKWYRKAAEQEEVRAQLYLGWCYEYGKGVSMSHSEAIKWYRKAAQQGNEVAQEFLRRLGVSY